MIFNVGSGGASSADKVKYDNRTSGLKATNVQGAVDEVNNRLNYSTDEQIIGTWIDGKPIYRQVFVSNTTLSIDSTLKTFTIGNIQNCEKLIRVDVLINDKNDNLSVNYSLSNSGYSGYVTSDGKVNISYMNIMIKNPTCIIEYTKTTD